VERVAVATIAKIRSVRMRRTLRRNACPATGGLCHDIVVQ
jgi:hypothetical protein